MARSLRYALLILPLLMTTACRFVDQQKDLAARIAAFCVLRPVLAMQSSQATLTQATFRDTDLVAAKRTLKVAPAAPAAASAHRAEEVIRVASVQPTKPASKAKGLIAEFVIPGDAVRVHFAKTEQRAVALAEARGAIAVARCQVQMQLQKERPLARRKIVVIMPSQPELPAVPYVIDFVGQGS